MTRRLFRHLVAATWSACLVCILASQSNAAPLRDEVWLENLTWPEVRDLVAAGKTVAIVPTGGTEQNGPHIVLGKHNFVLRNTAERVARALGNALVAPVMTYVPEGDTAPPSGHMRWPGTLSLPEPVFAAVLEATASSLRAHGFTLICFLGESGGNQTTQKSVADTLNDAWTGSGARVLHVGDYYDANGQMDWLLEQGETEASVGGHAGIRDTSEVMAAHPDGIRRDRLGEGMNDGFDVSGVDGDPTRASPARGEVLLQLKVDAAVHQIRRVLTD